MYFQAPGIKPQGASPWEGQDGWNTVGLLVPRVFLWTLLHLVGVLCFRYVFRFHFNQYAFLWVSISFPPPPNFSLLCWPLCFLQYLDSPLGSHQVCLKLWSVFLLFSGLQAQILFSPAASSSLHRAVWFCFVLVIATFEIIFWKAETFFFSFLIAVWQHLPKNICPSVDRIVTFLYFEKF